MCSCERERESEAGGVCYANQQPTLVACSVKAMWEGLRWRKSFWKTSTGKALEWQLTWSVCIVSQIMHFCRLFVCHIVVVDVIIIVVAAVVCICVRIYSCSSSSSLFSAKIIICRTGTLSAFTDFVHIMKSVTEADNQSIVLCGELQTKAITRLNMCRSGYKIANDELNTIPCCSHISFFSLLSDVICCMFPVSLSLYFLADCNFIFSLNREYQRVLRERERENVMHTQHCMQRPSNIQPNIYQADWVDLYNSNVNALRKQMGKSSSDTCLFIISRFDYLTTIH